ncbi:MAG: flagellar motor protein MotB [Clostridiales bacterium]|nr:flagellar motor protein MotB [Clostridiales bacterium]
MAGRQKKEERDASNDWLTTYSDMITLVLTFFILLYSSSTLDEAKWQQIYYAFKGQSIDLKEDVPLVDDGVYVVDEEPTEGTNVKKPYKFDELAGYVKSLFEGTEISDFVEVSQGKSYILIRFQSQIYFDGDSYVLKEEGKKVLSKLVPAFKTLEPYILKMEVSGHTANAISAVNGWDLSGMRASTVLKFFEYNKALPSEKLYFKGMGHTQPIADNSTDEGRQKNRRVELLLWRNDVDYYSPEIIKEILEKDYNIGVNLPSDPQNTNESEVGNPDKYPEGSAEYFIETFKNKFGQNPITEYNPNIQVAPMPVKLD